MFWLKKLSHNLIFLFGHLNKFYGIIVDALFRNILNLIQIPVRTLIEFIFICWDYKDSILIQNQWCISSSLLNLNTNIPIEIPYNLLNLFLFILQFPFQWQDWNPLKSAKSVVLISSSIIVLTPVFITILRYFLDQLKLHLTFFCIKIG